MCGEEREADGGEVEECFRDRYTEGGGAAECVREGKRGSGDEDRGDGEEEGDGAEDGYECLELGGRKFLALRSVLDVLFLRRENLKTYRYFGGGLEEYERQSERDGESYRQN